MPQFEILGMVGLLAIVSTPDHHPGGSVCLKWFAGLKKRSHEFVIKEKNQIRQHLQSSKASSCFHQFENMLRAVQEAKSWYSEAPSNSHSNASKIN